jgi:pantetheine-phosphate adenylyltransferase
LSRRAVLAGSFDPFTVGHLDILTRGLTLFDEVVLACGSNPAKRYRFPLEQRLELLRASTAHLEGVRVAHFSGLLIHFCREVGAGAILRGLRGQADFEFEATIGRANRDMAPDIESVFLLSDPRQIFTSSSLIKEIFDGGGDVSSYVPAPVLAALVAQRGER